MAQSPKTKKTTTGPLKSFMAAGPTLHYSHPFVLRFWGLAVVMYILACWGWNRIVIGGVISLIPADLIDPALWNLGRFVAFPLSIYEYPWQIVVLGTVMGILAATPVLVSQLYSFRYSIPFIVSVMFIAGLYFFGLFVTLGCIAVACRPLRFRSRFIGIMLCLSPQMVYWALWGGYSTADPLRWGFSYSPWIYAWLMGLFMAAVVLGIGHYTRYRPGLIFAVTLVMLAATYGVFRSHIGFAELDYQLYVAGNNPEEATEFHSYSLSEVIDAVIADDAQRSFLTGRYYPIDAEQLRERLKAEVEQEMRLLAWPWWFVEKMPERLNYRRRRDDLLLDYQVFKDRWPQSKRMPITLYFTALLNEYHPDIRHFRHTETLRFYNDYPFKSNVLIWQELFNRFPQSPESLEARWRLAWHDAAEGRFERAMELTQVTRTLVRQQLEKTTQQAAQQAGESIFAAFEPPSPTVLGRRKLRNLDLRLRNLQRLIDPVKRGSDDASRRRLAVFIGLNPYSLEYEARLNTLLSEMTEDDPLRGDVLLAKAMTIPDPHDRASALTELMHLYRVSDVGARAHYEKAQSLLQLWKDSELEGDQRRVLLEDIRQILTTFLVIYAESIYADQAHSLLQTLPSS